MYNYEEQLANLCDMHYVIDMSIKQERENG